MENTNSYQLSTSVNNGILEITLTGTVPNYRIPMMQEEIQALRAEKGEMILLDIRPVTKGNTYTNADLYYLRIPNNATGRTAILDIQGNEHIKLFIEKISWGTSLEVKWFYNIDEAKDWLKGAGGNAI